MELVLTHWRQRLRPNLPQQPSGQWFTDAQVGPTLAALRRHWTPVELMAAVEGVPENKFNRSDPKLQTPKVIFGSDDTVRELAALCPRDVLRRLRRQYGPKDTPVTPTRYTAAQGEPPEQDRPMPRRAAFDTEQCSGKIDPFGEMFPTPPTVQDRGSKPRATGDGKQAAP